MVCPSSGDAPARAPERKPAGALADTLTRSLTGRVVSFDDEAGLGELEPAPGGAETTTGRITFHCTAVADGTRHIDVGVTVRFVLVPGHAGRFEARDLVPLQLQDER